MDQIFTKWHKVMEALKQRKVHMRKGTKQVFDNIFDFEHIDYLFKLIDEYAQHYILAPEIRKLMHDKIEDSMEDLLQAHIETPPFESITVEMPSTIQSVVNYNGADTKGRFTTFVIIIARPPDMIPKPSSIWEELGDTPVWCVTFDLLEISGDNHIIFCPFLAGVKGIILDDTNRKELSPTVTDASKRKVATKMMPFPPKWIKPKYRYKIEPEEYIDELNDMGYCYQMMMVLMNTRGVAKKTIEAPQKLNKARASSPEKHPIPDHIVIHIGHVYDRSGKEHAYTGRHLRVHWRAGHVRHQRVGPRSMSEVKLIYIQPCLVNYDPGTEQPEKPTRIVVY